MQPDRWLGSTNMETYQTNLGYRPEKLSLGPGWVIDAGNLSDYNYTPEASPLGSIGGWLCKEWWRMTSASNGFKSAILIGTFAAAATLGGCASSNSSYAKAAEYQSDPTPHLHTLNERGIDIDNRQAITNDENLRMLNDDLTRFFLLDRQSRLTPAPVPR